VYVVVNFENVNKDNVEEWLQSDVCELSFQHAIIMDIVNSAVKRKGNGEEDENEEGQSSVGISHSLELHYVVTTGLHGSERFQIQWHYCCQENSYCHEDKSKEFSKTSDHCMLFLKVNFSSVKNLKYL
jgi:hypothetical protein